MMLWLVLAALTAGSVAALLVPLVRRAGAAPARADYDIAVYRSQLAEIAEEVERGLLAAEQGEAAGTEIARRILAAADAEPKSPPHLQDNRRARTVAALVVVLMLPLGSGLLYAALGSWDLPGRPYAERLKHDHDVMIAAAAEKLAAQLENQPNAPGYKRLADMYFSLRDNQHAAAAYLRAIVLGADDADTWSKLGEAIVMGNGGTVGPEAITAFAHALDLEPREPQARFYLGLAEAQSNHLREAVAVWRDLEKDSKPDAPWLPVLRRHIAAFAKQGGFDPAAIAPQPARP